MEPAGYAVGGILIITLLLMVFGIYALGRSHERNRPTREARNDAEAEAQRLAARRLRGSRLLKRLRGKE